MGEAEPLNPAPAARLNLHLNLNMNSSEKFEIRNQKFEGFGARGARIRILDVSIVARAFRDSPFSSF